MAKAKKTETAAPGAVQAEQKPQELTQDTQEVEAVSETPESVQEGQEPQEVTQDTQDIEAVSMAPESGQDGTAQEIIGPEDESDLLDCPSVPAGEPSAVVFPEYAVVGCERLNLREEPRLDAPVVAELPCGVGVSGNGRPAQDGWRLVFTGRLFGWVMDEYLEPIVLSHAAE